MGAKEKIKEELISLEDDGMALIQLIDAKDKGLSFHYKYQAWYSLALPVVGRLAHERYEEFRRYYEADPKRKSLGYDTFVIQDYLTGLVPNRISFPNFDTKGRATICLLNQITILSSINNRIDSALIDLEGTLSAELQESEIETAIRLSKVNSRAGGTLAGVVLESHLQRVRLNHSSKIAKKNPTIGDLNDSLKANGVYTLTTWKKITYLADIRNLCSHQKGTDPTADQIKELIDGVKWVIGNVD